jgi:vesicular inhibitory amino acid transporter
VVGWANGLWLLLVFGCLAFYSGVLLWRLRNFHPDGITYGDLAGLVVGLSGQKIVFGFIYVAFFGTMASYVLACAKTVKAMLYGVEDLCLPTCTLAVAAVLLPFCQLRSLHEVSYAALFSSLTITGALVLILDAALNHGSSSLGTTSGFVAFGDAPFLKAMGASTTAIFAFGGQGLYMETMAEMRRPEEFPKALKLVSVGIFLVYAVVSLACYAALGNETPRMAHEVIPNGPAKVLASGLIAAHVAMSYVLASQVICRAIHVRTWPEDVDSGQWAEKRQWMIITSATLAATWFIANAVPNFESLMGLIGAVATAPLTFGAPAIFYAIECGRRGIQVGFLEQVLLATMVLTATFLMLVGVYSHSLDVVAHWGEGTFFQCEPPK